LFQPRRTHAPISRSVDTKTTTNNEGAELCLEQHITPDVGFAMQQYYRWTGDDQWLRGIGWPGACA
jgi:trehalose/maltose hydrolase-like predicted phosphorylase